MPKQHAMPRRALQGGEWGVFCSVSANEACSTLLVHPAPSPLFLFSWWSITLNNHRNIMRCTEPTPGSTCWVATRCSAQPNINDESVNVSTFMYTHAEMTHFHKWPSCFMKRPEAAWLLAKVSSLLLVYTCMCSRSCNVHPCWRSLHLVASQGMLVLIRLFEPVGPWWQRQLSAVEV